MSPGSDIFRRYTIMQLYSAGMRFGGEFNEDDAVALYLAHHPEAVEADVRGELDAALTARASKGPPTP